MKSKILGCLSAVDSVACTVGFGGGGMHFGGAPFAGRRVFVNRFNNFNRFNRFDDFAFRHHHRFCNFGFFGEPFFDDYTAAYEITTMRPTCQSASDRDPRSASRCGIEICMPIHDALMILAPLNRLDEDIATTNVAMAEASRIILNGFELRTEAKEVRWPDRYMDLRGADMWGRIMRVLRDIETSEMPVAAE